MSPIKDNFQNEYAFLFCIFGFPFETWCCMSCIAFVYSMRSVKICRKNGVLGIVHFPNTQEPSSLWVWDKSKNPCPLRSHTSSNEATAGAPGTMRPAALCFPGPAVALLRFLNGYGFLIYFLFDAFSIHSSYKLVSSFRHHVLLVI